MISQFYFGFNTMIEFLAKATGVIFATTLFVVFLFLVVLLFAYFVDITHELLKKIL